MMQAIRFQVTIGEDRAIHFPPEIRLDPGVAEVIVLLSPQSQNGTKEVPQESIGARLARFAEESGIRGLPPDLARNHDHYLHGLPKGVDEQ